MTSAISIALASKQRLVERAATQRMAIANAAEPLRGALGKLDQARQVMQSARRFALPVGIFVLITGAAFVFLRRRGKRSDGVPSPATRPVAAIAAAATSAVRLARSVFSWWQVTRMAMGFVAQAASVASAFRRNGTNTTAQTPEFFVTRPSSG